MEHPQINAYNRKEESIKVVPDSPAYVQKVTIFWHVKNSSKLIYFDKNNRTLPCFLKSY